MSVQRYVFRYKPHRTLESFRQWMADYSRHPVEQHEQQAQDAYRNHMAIYGDQPYEKEGGGLTTELSEAKLIGWRSAKKWKGERMSWRGDLIPARIVLD